MERLRSLGRAIPDVVLALFGLAFGGGSLGYPFGRDQGLYHYVAREWVGRGSVPYRDVLDHKTPGIYLVHAASVALFGDTMWGIRVLDLACVLLLGLVGSSAAYGKGEAIPRGFRGVGVVVASLLYYGYLDFWNTAQSEIWYATLGVAAVWAARRVEGAGRAAALSGLLAGMGMVMKPPSVWLVGVAFALVVARGLGEGPPGARGLARAAVRFTAGAAAAPALVAAVFAVQGALGAMVDVVVFANRHYVEHERGARTAAEVWHHTQYYLRTYAPLVALVYAASAASMIVGVVRREWALFGRHCLALAVTVAAYLAVSMQGKFYLLHWTVMLAGFVVAAAVVARTAIDLAPDPSYGAPALGAWVGALVLAWSRCDGPHAAGPKTWWAGTSGVVLHATGRMSRADLDARFEHPGIGFWYGHSRRVGEWLRDHTSPEETVTVRGFQPEIYTVARRRHAGRFFWTTFIVAPERAYRRAEWLAEDARDLDAHPPRYVVTLTGVADGPDSNAWFERRGYRVVVVMDELTIMAR